MVNSACDNDHCGVAALRHARWFWLSLLAASLLVGTGQPRLSQAAEPAQDWPCWRGPDRSGISAETGLLTEWKEAPPLLWQVDNLGSAFSSVSIASGKIYTMGQRKRKTELICLDLADGRELWSVAVGNGRPNCTPTVDVDGNLVFGMSREGELVACDATTGDEKWRKSFRNDYNGRMMSGWGYSESPLVDGDKLICTPGAADAVLVALDKRSGKTLWKAAAPPEIGNRGKEGAGYASPVISNAAGVKQYLQLTGRGMISVAADDGRVLWTYNRIANSTANIPTPLVSGNHVFCSTGYGTGAALLEVLKDGEKLKVAERYFLDSKTLQNHHGGMILIDGYVYCGHGHNKGFPLCLELKSGEVKWGGRIRGPGSGSAAVLAADGHLYFRYEDGTIALIEATPEEYRLKGEFKMATRNGKSWPHPVIHNGRLYLRDQQSLLCYDIRKPE